MKFKLWNLNEIFLVIYLHFYLLKNNSKNSLYGGKNFSFEGHFKGMKRAIQSIFEAKKYLEKLQILKSNNNLICLMLI